MPKFLLSTAPPAVNESGSGARTPAAPVLPPTELALWNEWRETRSEHAHRQLTDLHGDYARVVAASYYGRRYNDEIEFAEYAQLAYVGLLEAMDRFDPAFGVQFRTFAARRMHGAILDGMEKLTEKQQQLAAMRRLRAQRRESLVDEPHDAAAAPRTPAQALKFVSEVGLGLAVAWLLEGTGMVDAGDRFQAQPFYQSVELRELRNRLLQLVKDMPAQQSRVITGHYLQELPFEEIATSMGLTRGRISQIHKQALATLRVSWQAPPGQTSY